MGYTRIQETNDKRSYRRQDPKANPFPPPTTPRRSASRNLAVDNIQGEPRLADTVRRSTKACAGEPQATAADRAETAPLKPGSLLSTCFLRHIPPRGRREAAKRRASPDHADPEPTRITIDGKRHRRAASRHHPSAAPQHVQRQSTSSPLASSVRLPYSIRSNGPYNSQIRCLITDLKTDIVQERRMPPSTRCRFHAICRHGQPTFFVFLHRVSPRNLRYTGKENKQTNKQ